MFPIALDLKKNTDFADFYESEFIKNADKLSSKASTGAYL